MVAIQGKKDNQIKQPVHVDNDGNIILSSSSIIDIDDIDTIAEVVKVTTVGTITNTVTVSGTVASTQSGTWNIGTLTSITDTVNVLEDRRYVTNIYTSGYQTIPSGTEEYEVYELSVPYDAAYLNKMGSISIANLSAFYDLNVQVRQVVTTTGGTLRVATHQFTAPSIEKKRPSTTAYSSCVTYNKTGPAWTDQSINFDNEYGYNADFPLSEVDDAIYFGSKSKFNSISIFIDTAGVYNATLVWEFWNGSAWVSPTVLIDNSNELQSTAGQYYIVLIEGLTNWTANSPDGASMVNQYWLRLRCSAFTSVTTSPSVRTVLFKPVQYNAFTTFDLQEVFGNANQTTQILVTSTSDVDDTHEIIYNIGIGAR